MTRRHTRRILPTEDSLGPLVTFCLAASFIASALMLIGAAFLAVTAWVWLVNVL